MASSVSQLNNYSNFSLFSFDNKDLLMKGMLMKQNAIDENRGKLQQIRDQVANFSVVKDVDKQYLNERITQTTDIINKYAGGDLSNPNLMNQLVSKFEEVVDDKVLNAVASSSAIIREDKQWEAEEGKPGYSEKNRQYAMQNRIKYLQDGNVGAEYAGGGGFIKYTDNNAKLMSKEAQETLKNLGINAKFVQREDGSGYFDFTNTYEGTTDVKRLREAVVSIIGEDGFKQMQIDAWANYGDMSNPEVVTKLREDYNQVFQNDLERLEEDRTYLQKAVENEKDPELKKQLQEQLDDTNETIDIRKKDSDFDSKVFNPDGTINESNYKNAYTSLYTHNEIGRLTAVQYQKPRLVEQKIDNSRLEMAKFNLQLAQFKETVEHNDVMEGLKEYELQMKYNPQGSSNQDGLVNPNDVSIGVETEVSKEQAGEFDLFTQLRTEQEAPIKELSKAVGFTFDRASTLNLIEQLQGQKIGDIKEIKIGGRTIKITDENRGQILPTLDKFKKTMVDGGSVIRQTRDRLGTTIDLVTDDVVGHYKKASGEHKNMFEGDNFYFRKGQNGTFEYVKGKMPGVKESNYKLLMYKASKNGVNSLSKEDQMTLKAYVTKGIVSDKGLKLNAWERQQSYIAFQEELNKNLGAKAVNTMPKYNNFSYIKSTDDWNNGYGGDMVGGNENEVGKKYGSSFTKQDQSFSGFGWGDTKTNEGLSLSEQINQRLKVSDKLIRTEAENQAKAVKVRPINIVDGSKTMKNLEAKFSVSLKGRNAQFIPEIQDGKQTGRWQLYYEQDVLAGEKKIKQKLPAKDLNGNVMIVNQEEVGLKVGNFSGSIYNSALGSRSAKIELGRSNGQTYEQGDIRNKTLDENAINYLRSIVKTPEKKEILDYYVNLYNSGQIDFEMSVPEGSDTYHLIMDIKGKRVNLFDTRKSILDEDRDVAFFYQNANQTKEDNFLEYLQRVIK